MSNATPPAMDKLCEESRRVFEAFPIRKSRAQKEAFCIEATTILLNAGWPVATEESGALIKCRNLVAGNPETARVILTAHYDTPAVLPLPNFIAPRNLPLTFLYQLLLAMGFFVVGFLVSFGLLWLGAPFPVTSLALLLVVVALMVLMLAGPANRHNYNDNTSGVLTLLEVAQTLPAELQPQVALVFFDNEELGLLGSAAFLKTHPRLRGRLLLNFDCVGDGDTLLFCLPRAVKKSAATKKRLEDAFLPDEGCHVLWDTSPFTFYPSDQMHYKSGVAVAALTKRPLVGYCVGRLHTPRDVILRQQNLVALRSGCVRLAAALAEAGRAGAAQPEVITN